MPSPSEQMKGLIEAGAELPESERFTPKRYEAGDCSLERFESEFFTEALLARASIALAHEIAEAARELPVTLADELAARNMPLSSKLLAKLFALRRTKP